MIILESLCDHPVTRYTWGTYVVLDLAGIRRTPQFAAGTSLSRVGP